jgi:hypothetical protein
MAKRRSGKRKVARGSPHKLQGSAVKREKPPTRSAKLRKAVTPKATASAQRLGTSALLRTKGPLSATAQAAAVSQSRLKTAVQTWVLDNLGTMFPEDAVSVGSSLAKWAKDRLDSLTNLAIAFYEDVEDGSALGGLVNLANFHLPTDKYVAVVTRERATVASIINFFVQRAQAATP